MWCWCPRWARWFPDGRKPRWSGSLRSQSERASARRACWAARSARRESRRAIASWCPRRSSCASPRRADICARARSSFIRFILVLRFWKSVMSRGFLVVSAGTSYDVTACGRARGGPGGRPAPRDATCAGRGRAGGRGEVARPPPDARGAATERGSLIRTWHSPLSFLRLLAGRCCCAAGPAACCCRSGGPLVLAGPAAGPLAGDPHSLQEQLATPDTPGFTPLEGPGEALGASRAVQAERLGNLDVLRSLGEEQLGVLPTARQLLHVDLVRGDRVCVEDADTHLLSPPCEKSFSFVGETERPRIPGFGFRGLEAAELMRSHLGGGLQ